MKKITFTLLFMAIAFLGSAQENITGDWYGLLKVQGIRLHIVFHIVHGESGYTATMDSPDQGTNGIEVTETSFANDSLNLQLTALNALYKGRLTKDQTITGTFTQNGYAIPLNLSRQSAGDGKKEAGGTDHKTSTGTQSTFSIRFGRGEI